MRRVSGGAITIATAMIKELISPFVPHDLESGIRRGNGALNIARWLGLAAAPTFAMMALWTGLSSDHPDMLCMSMQGSSPLSGMTVMYMLMGAFHLSPWIKLVSGRRSVARRRSQAAFGHPSPSERS